MTKVKRQQQAQITVTELEEFLRNPPVGFSVSTVDSEHRVHFDTERNLVLIDDFNHRRERIVFHKSLGRKVKIHNLRDYTTFRKSLLSRKIYFCVCERKVNGEVKQHVVCLNGSNPYIKWQLERGLDWTISSVAGESYKLAIDVRQLLELETEAAPLWTDTGFTLKYYSDAMFDFPHWLGFSRRRVQVMTEADMKACAGKSLEKLINTCDVMVNQVVNMFG